LVPGEVLIVHQIRGFVTASLLLALSCPAIGFSPGVLPNEVKLTAVLAGDPPLAQEVAQAVTGLSYRHVLAAYAHVQAVRHLKSGHLIDAQRWHRVAGRILRGEPVEVDNPSAVPFPAGERVNFDLLTKVPIIGSTRIGRAFTLVQPTVLADGRLALHVTAEVIVEKYQPGRTKQEIFADPATYMITRSEVTEYDGNGAVKRQWVDLFDHAAHTIIRQSQGQQPVPTTYPATHLLSSHAWVPYFMRGVGFEVGSSWNLALVSETQPIVFSVTRKTNLGADKVLEGRSTPNRISAWFFDEARRLPRRVMMVVDTDQESFFSDREVTLEYKNVEIPNP
jgi:hypothetical protein